MGGNNLKHSSELQSLEAENKHLKNMLRRYVSDKNAKDVSPRSLLSNFIEEGRGNGDDFDNIVCSCLRNIGVHYGVDRVSVFTFKEEYGAYATRWQWASGVVLSYSPEDLYITREENPLPNANIGRCFASADFNKDLCLSLKNKLDILGTQSILLIPVSLTLEEDLVVVFESCAFKRRWYDFEVAEMESEVMLMAARLDALWHKRKVRRIWDLNTLRNQLFHQLKALKRTSKALNQALEIIGEALDLRSIYWVDQSSFSNGHELSWTKSPDHEDALLSNEDLEKLNLDSYGQAVRCFDVGALKSAGVNVKKGTLFFIFNRTVVRKGFSGWLVGEFSNYSPYSVHELMQFWESMALILSQQMNQVFLEQEHNSRYAQLMEQNRKLVFEQGYLEKVLDDIPLSVLVIESNQIRYANASACTMLGWSTKELETLKLDDIICDNSKKEIEEVIRGEGKDVGYSGCVSVCTKSGKQVETELRIHLVSINNQVYYHFTFHDIALRKDHESALRKSKKEFFTLAHNSPNIILRLTEGGEIMFFNRAFVYQFQLEKKNEILNNTLQGLGILNHSKQRIWQTKLNDVFAHGEMETLELRLNNGTEELYFDWTLSPENDENEKVQTVLAIGRNLTQYKYTEQQLVRAKVRAEESDKLKSEFLANISHELRTPLNAIVGFSSLIRGQQLSPNKIDEYVDVIHKNSDNLMSLINNIIDVARIKSGQISVIKEKVLLDDLLQNVYEEFVPRVEVEHRGRVKLFYAKPKDACVTIMTDSIRLRQVLVNLLNNAMKFTIKGLIEFGFSVEKRGVRIFVKDTGIGICEAKQKVIFQPFRKGFEDDEDRIYRGTGIGLAICDKLINALGGEIGLISEKNKGSEFYFIHPLGMNRVGDEHEDFVNRVPIPALQKSYSWNNKMMLLVDENSGAHLQMRKYIEKTGITLVSARTAASASKLLMNRNDIHLVLMDMSFPDSDGFKLVKTIKQLDKNIPVIAHISEMTCSSKEWGFVENGFDASIMKSASKEELLALMNQFLIEMPG